MEALLRAGPETGVPIESVSEGRMLARNVDRFERGKIWMEHENADTGTAVSNHWTDGARVRAASRRDCVSDVMIEEMS